MLVSIKKMSLSILDLRYTNDEAGAMTIEPCILPKIIIPWPRG
jgi:hypothetical protein